MWSYVKRASALKLAGAAALSLAGVALLALAVTSSSTVTRLDAMASADLQVGGIEPVIAASLAVTALGATDTVLPLTVLAVGLLACCRQWHGAVALALSVGVTQAVVALVKDAVARPRPLANEAIADAGGSSFPSGHSATTAALFGVLALVALRSTHGWVRVAIACASIAVIAGVGVTRVLLGAHYPTDVMAGWLTGGTIALLSFALLLALRRAARRTAAA